MRKDLKEAKELVRIVRRLSNPETLQVNYHYLVKLTTHRKDHWFEVPEHNWVSIQNLNSDFQNSEEFRNAFSESSTNLYSAVHTSLRESYVESWQPGNVEVEKCLKKATGIVIAKARKYLISEQFQDDFRALCMEKFQVRVTEILSAYAQRYEKFGINAAVIETAAVDCASKFVISSVIDS